jgi:hypothetical protein
MEIMISLPRGQILWSRRRKLKKRYRPVTKASRAPPLQRENEIVGNKESAITSAMTIEKIKNPGCF